MTEKTDLSKLMENKTFCSMAWNHQFLDPTGRVKPCCRFQENNRPEENNLHKNSLRDIFYGSWMDDVRAKMLKGESVEGCARCYQEEQAGKKSLRQRYHDNVFLPAEKLVDLDKPKIRWLELAISNQCNLACRMCDSRYSWKWFEEEKEMYGFTFSPDKVSATKIDEVFPFLKDVVHLKFTGGEPLITKEHWQIIDKLVDERDCSEIFLNYSTNCTIEPKQDWIKKWDKFKLIEFALSYDSADPKEAEYIRWPAKYQKIEDTTKQFLEMGEKENYFCILRTTVSLLNIWNLPETILWWLENTKRHTKRVNPTHLTHPYFLSATILPKHIKDRISEKFETYLKGDYPKEMIKTLDYMNRYMHSKDTSKYLYKLKNYIEKTDAHRKQNFFEYYPQFHDIFEGMAEPEEEINEL